MVTMDQIPDSLDNGGPMGRKLWFVTFFTSNLKQKLLIVTKMNSDSDYDWDSMSEAPLVTEKKSIDGNTKYPPPPLGNNSETRNKIDSQAHLVTNSNSHTQQSENNQRELANIIAQEDAVKQHIKKISNIW